MNTTAELSWIFSNLPVFPLVCAGRGYLFPAGGYAFYFVYFAYLQKPQLFSSTFKLKLLDQPLQPRACASNSCAHPGVRACL